jgi:hypothetical protein
MKIDMDNLTVVTAWHGNMGYVQDEHGNYTDRHKGYAYGYRCVEHPRFTFEDRHHTLDDGGYERTYMVDGEKCEYDDIARLLSEPPKLTLIEFVCLLRIGDVKLPWFSLVDVAAGCEQPTPQYIDSKTHWGRIYGVMEHLREKGLIDVKRGKAHRSTK